MTFLLDTEILNLENCLLITAKVSCLKEKSLCLQFIGVNSNCAAK